MKKIKLTEQQFKKLIENILYRENQGDFITTQTGFDPKTRSISWSVEYKTNLNKTHKEIDEIVKRLEDLVSENDNEDSQELSEISKLLRNKFSRYKRKYL